MRPTQRLGKAPVGRSHFQGRKAADIAAGLAQEVCVVCGDRMGTQQLVAPDAITKVHSAKDPLFREVGEDAPHGGLVLAAFELLHELFVGERTAVFLQAQQHGDSNRGGPQSMVAELGSKFFTSVGHSFWQSHSGPSHRW